MYFKTARGFARSYMLLAGILMEPWLNDEVLPDLEVSTRQRSHSHPLLPRKALILDPVDRLSPVFFTPGKLRAQLERITSMTYKDN